MQFFFIPIGFAVAAYASIFFFFSFGCPPLAEISDKHGEGERRSSIQNNSEKKWRLHGGESVTFRSIDWLPGATIPF